MKIVRCCFNCHYWYQNPPYRLVHPQKGSCLCNEPKKTFSGKYYRFPATWGHHYCHNFIWRSEELRKREHENGRHG